MPRSSKRRTARKAGAISKDLFEAIEAERTQLRRAVSLMVAMRFALNYQDWIEDEADLDFADLAHLACELTRSAMNNLDAAKLPKPDTPPASGS